jgi:hypothetical protein
MEPLVSKISKFIPNVTNIVSKTWTIILLLHFLLFLKINKNKSFLINNKLWICLSNITIIVNFYILIDTY